MADSASNRGSIASRATEILRAIHSQESFEAITQRILEAACELTGSVHGSFVRVVPGTGQLRIEATLGPDWTPESRATSLSVGQGVTGLAALRGEPYVCNDTRKDPNYVQLFPQIRSELAVPVIADGVVWGIINVDGTKPNEYDQTIVTEITLFAELIAAAMEFRIKWDRERALYDRLAQADKLTAAGQLLASIAHEINNPLAAILGTSTLLAEDLSQSAYAESAKLIERQAQRAGDLVRNLLTYSRQAESDLREVEDLVHVVRESLDLVRPHLRLKRAALEFSLPRDNSLFARVNRIQIQQVLVNLITNSQHAIEQCGEPGRISISLDCDATHVALAVQDNGIGMSRASRQKLFQPFYTTKRKGAGTGLGLSISKDIASNHNGELTCSSTIHRGSRFQLRLPLDASASLQAVRIEPEPQRVVTPESKLQLLVVDDEAPIRWMLQKLLRPVSGGLEVAETAESALAMALNRRFDLVVSDVHMGEMDGVELFHRVQAANGGEGPYFILMTGDSSDPRVRRLAGQPRIEIMEKPFSMKRMLERVTALGWRNRQEYLDLCA